MRAAELGKILLGVACASCGAAPAPLPASSDEPRAAPRPDAPPASAPQPSASGPEPPASPTSVASATPAPSASAAPPPPRDPRLAVGPEGETIWSAGLASDAHEKLSRTCQGRTALSVSCSVPDQEAARAARADRPVSECPRVGPVLEIRCAGCGARMFPGGGGALQEALTTHARRRAPAACCYAGCMPLPRPPPPTAGRPLGVGGVARVASLVRARGASAARGAASW